MTTQIVKPYTILISDFIFVCGYSSKISPRKLKRFNTLSIPGIINHKKIEEHSNDLYCVYTLYTINGNSLNIALATGDQSTAMDKNPNTECFVNGGYRYFVVSFIESEDKMKEISKSIKRIGEFPAHPLKGWRYLISDNVPSRYFMG